jgi:hypothetical protein
MTNKTKALSLLAMASAVSLSQAQTTPAATASASAPALSPTEQTIKDIKNPASWLTWGADMRLRNEYENNAGTLGADAASSQRIHEQDYFRFRGRVWTSITPAEGLSLNSRLAAEPREFMKPAYTRTAGHSAQSDSGFEGRYGIFDILNIKWSKPGDLPLTVTVGRQEINNLGDGWLIMDGTPIDGSFTTFFDAARLTWELKEQHTTIDAIGLIQSARPDAWLPTLGPSTEADPRAYSLSDQNEKGAILWVANKSIPEANLDGYFIYKNDSALYGGRSISTTADDGDIYTLGGRLSGLVREHFKYSVEGAYQCGWKEDGHIVDTTGVPAGDRRALSAFGINSKATYLVKDKLNNQVGFSYEFLSGDDKGTHTDEMFDVLWGRYPRWTELAPYMYGPGAETRTAQMNNYHRFGPGWAFTPAKDLDFNLNYFVLFADQSTPTRYGSASSFGGDSFRGHFLQSVLKYKFNQHVSGHLWGEVLFPGDYYANHETMAFLRAELMFTF